MTAIMTATMTVDAARVELLLSELRMPNMKVIWAKLAAQSDKEGWPAAKLLAAQAEHEVADRGRRRFERHLAEARLPPGKTLASLDFEATPMVSKAQVMALTAGHVWLKTGANVLIFGPPGGGKSHLSAAIGPDADRERLVRPVHPYHRPRPASVGGATRAGAGKRDRAIPPELRGATAR